MVTKHGADQRIFLILLPGPREHYQFGTMLTKIYGLRVSGLLMNWVASLWEGRSSSPLPWGCSPLGSELIDKGSLSESPLWKGIGLWLLFPSPVPLQKPLLNFTAIYLRLSKDLRTKAAFSTRLTSLEYCFLLGFEKAIPIQLVFWYF